MKKWLRPDLIVIEARAQCMYVCQIIGLPQF